MSWSILRTKSAAPAPFLKRGLADREARRRRRLLVAMGVLMLFAASPVLVHHLTGGLDTLLHARDHVWVICLVALHHLLQPVHEIFHALLVTGIVYAVFDRWRAWSRHRRILALVTASPVMTAAPTHEAARLGGVPTGIIRLVDGLPLPAFTTGWIRPLIFVSTALEQQLTTEQLAAVLAHEYAHVLRRDPARLTFLRALGCLFFWLPALRRLADDVADDAEVLADDFAVRGDPVPLASAILALAQWKDRPDSDTRIAQFGGTVVGFQRNAMLDRRIHRLLGGESNATTRLTRPSLVAAIMALSLAWVSGLAVAHPMTGTSSHCAHQRLAAYAHLFCLAGSERHLPGDCPHHGDSP